jgi:hypothetical protein
MHPGKGSLSAVPFTSSGWRGRVLVKLRLFNLLLFSLLFLCCCFFFVVVFAIVVSLLSLLWQVVTVAFTVAVAVVYPQRAVRR